LIHKIIPPDCILLSTLPARFEATTGYTAAYLDSDLNRSSSKKCFIFIEDLSCSYPQRSFIEKCETFKRKNNLSVYGYVTSSGLGGNGKYNFTIYSVS
jgi:hypothetical protein